MRGFSSENGMIALETLLSFVAFYMVISIVLLFVHIASAQTRIHYALTQVAKETAVYARAFEMLGVIEAINKVEENTAETKEELNDMIENGLGIFDEFSGVKESAENLDVGALKDSFDSIKEDASDMSEQFEEWANDPEKFFTGMMWFAIQKGLDTGFDYIFGTYIAPVMFERYMDVYDGKSMVWGADSYLKQMRVDEGLSGIKFTEFTFDIRSGTDGMGATGSHFLSQGRTDEITVAVRYNVNFTPFRWVLNDLTKRPVVQEVKIKAWVGDGGRYDG